MDKFKPYEDAQLLIALKRLQKLRFNQLKPNQPPSSQWTCPTLHRKVQWRGIR